MNKNSFETDRMTLQILRDNIRALEETLATYNRENINLKREEVKMKQIQTYMLSEDYQGLLNSIDSKHQQFTIVKENYARALSEEKVTE